MKCTEIKLGSVTAVFRFQKYKIPPPSGHHQLVQLIVFQVLYVLGVSLDFYSRNLED